jgi:putative tryptophan/tyrosine transport system substrate-binding protein
VYRLCAAILLAASTHVLAAQVEIVLSEDAGAYAEAAAALRQDLAPGISTSTRIADAAEHTNGDSDIPAITIALGSRALKAALAGRGSRIISVLVPRQSYQAALQAAPRSRDPKTVTAIYLEQPYARQFSLIRAVLPGRSRVGILHSTEDLDVLAGLHAVAKAQGLELVDEVVSSQKDLFSALSRLLATADAILAIPDPTIFNSGNIPNILLASFRDGRPLFGFSSPYVRAGALAAVYSTPVQAAREAADVARRVLASGALTSPRYPAVFTVGVNTTVARSLHLSVPEGAELEAQLQAMEREK